MEIRCIKGMYMLNLVSSENNSRFKGVSCYNKYEHLRDMVIDSIEVYSTLLSSHQIQFVVTSYKFTLLP